MTINVPCVKSQMFGTQFFSGSMTFHAIDRQVLPPDDPRWDPIFPEEEKGQRALLRSRVTQSIVPYLLENRDDAFFSSLAIILVPADGSPLQEGKHYRFKPTNGNPNVGILEIEDDVMMFVADGQHRREAIKQALRQDSSIGMQHVPVVFVPFKKNGQVRQLFSDLNLNAKPVSKTQGLAFETRDPIVVATKQVAADVLLFRGPPSRVNMESNSLSTRSPYVVSMNTLKNAHAEVFSALYGKPLKDVASVSPLSGIKGLRPGDARVRTVSAPLVDFWEFVIGHLPPWQEVIDGTKKPGEIREGELAEADDETDVPSDSASRPEKDPWGGYVFAYGIGWQSIALAAAALIRFDPVNWKQMLGESLDQVDWHKGPHWNGISMVGTRVNNTGPGIRATAGYILERGGHRPAITSASTPDKSLFEVLDKSRAGINVEPPLAAE